MENHQAQQQAYVESPRRGEKVAERIYEKIMAEIFPNIIKIS